jgi:hypothetical protein
MVPHEVSLFLDQNWGIIPSHFQHFPGGAGTEAAEAREQLISTLVIPDDF